METVSVKFELEIEGVGKREEVVTITEEDINFRFELQDQIQEVFDKWKDKNSDWNWTIISKDNYDKYYYKGAESIIFGISTNNGFAADINQVMRMREILREDFILENTRDNNILVFSGGKDDTDINTCLELQIKTIENRILPIPKGYVERINYGI
jgi:hypothetical protein